MYAENAALFSRGLRCLITARIVGVRMYVVLRMKKRLSVGAVRLKWGITSNSLLVVSEQKAIIL